MRNALVFWGVLVFLAYFFLLPKPAFADSCSNLRINNKATDVVIVKERYPTLNIDFDVAGFRSGDQFIVCADGCGKLWTRDFIQRDISPSGNTISVTIKGGIDSNDFGRHTLHVRNQNIDPARDVCTFSYTIQFEDLFKDCRLTHRSETFNGKQYTPETNIFLSGSKLPNGNYAIDVDGKIKQGITVAAGNFPEVSLGRFFEGPHTARVSRDLGGIWEPTSCQTTFNISTTGALPGATAGPCPGLRGDPKDINSPLGKCIKCVQVDKGTWTALGCIPVNPAGFVSWLLQKVIGLAGGIAFLLILYGGFQILTSTGDPEKLASGKDIVVGALAGLLMIIFSVLLLRIIGYDILQIPGFITK